MSDSRYYLKEGSRFGFRIFLLPLIGVLVGAIVVAAVYYFVRREQFAPPTSPYSSTGIPLDAQAKQMLSYMECARDTPKICSDEQVNKGVRWLNGLTGGQLSVNGTPVIVNDRTTLRALGKQVASEPLSAYQPQVVGQDVTLKAPSDTFTLQFTTEGDQVRLVNITP